MPNPIAYLDQSGVDAALKLAISRLVLEQPADGVQSLAKYLAEGPVQPSVKQCVELPEVRTTGGEKLIESAVAAAARAEDEAVAAGAEYTEEWSVEKWLRSMKLEEEVALALLEPFDSKCFHTSQDHRWAAELAYVRALGDPGDDDSDAVDAMLSLLAKMPKLRRLAERLAEGAKQLSTERESGSVVSEVRGKFVAEDLAFGGLSTYDSGLEGLIGPPNHMLADAMRREHCVAADSDEPFTPTNYMVRTTSKVEWFFVSAPDGTLGTELPAGLGVDPGQPLPVQADGSLAWPSEAADLIEERQRRLPRPMHYFDRQMTAHNASLREIKLPPIVGEELLSLRLYTGPCAPARPTARPPPTPARARAEAGCRPRAGSSTSTTPCSARWARGSRAG